MAPGRGVQHHLFFDLDGTLTDPQQGIIACVRHALRALHQPVPAQRELLAWIGPPLRDSFAALVGDDAADDAVALYRQRFSTVGLFENRMYDGIGETLTALRNAGRTLFVVTSKPTVFAERIVEHFDIARHFAAVFGPDLDGSRAEKATLIAHVLANTGISAEDALMIGDRKHDVLGAKANGVAAAGVLWGYGSRDELLAAGADHIYERVEDLGSDLARR